MGRGGKGPREKAPRPGQEDSQRRTDAVSAKRTLDPTSRIWGRDRHPVALATSRPASPWPPKRRGTGRAEGREDACRAPQKNLDDLYDTRAFTGDGPVSGA